MFSFNDRQSKSLQTKVLIQVLCSQPAAQLPPKDKIQALYGWATLITHNGSLWGHRAMDQSQLTRSHQCFPVLCSWLLPHQCQDLTEEMAIWLRYSEDQAQHGGRVSWCTGSRAYISAFTAQIISSCLSLFKCPCHLGHSWILFGVTTTNTVSQDP